MLAKTQGPRRAGTGKADGIWVQKRNEKGNLSSRGQHGHWTSGGSEKTGEEGKNVGCGGSAQAFVLKAPEGGRGGGMEG